MPEYRIVYPNGAVQETDQLPTHISTSRGIQGIPEDFDWNLIYMDEPSIIDESEELMSDLVVDPITTTSIIDDSPRLNWHMLEEMSRRIREPRLPLYAVDPGVQNIIPENPSPNAWDNMPSMRWANYGSINYVNQSERLRPYSFQLFSNTPNHEKITIAKELSEEEIKTYEEWIKDEGVDPYAIE